MSSEISTRSVRRPAAGDYTTTSCDIGVVGAGISGVAAALEAAKLRRTVVIIDQAPALGGQAIGSIIGTIIGLYTHGEKPYQITHLVADDLIRDLDADGSLYRRKSMTNTVTFLYDEVRLGRWMETQIDKAGVTSIVGAVLTHVEFSNRRIQYVDFATRFGSVRIEAAGYVDASGDAALTYEAGCATRQPDTPIYGSLNFLIEGYDLAGVEELVLKDVHARLAEVGAKYGLVRHDGFL